MIASCVTPYGPGLLVYDIGVSRNGQIAQYISEWNSPNFHSIMTLLVYCIPLAVLVACIWTRRISLLEGSVGIILLRGGTPDPTTRRLPLARRRRPGRHPAGAGALGDDGPTMGGRWIGGPDHRHPGHPGGPGRFGGVGPARRGLQLSRRAPGTDLHGVHLGRLLGGAPPGHLRRRADGPLRGSCPHRVHGGDEPDPEPRPHPVRRTTSPTSSGHRTRPWRSISPTTIAGTW